MSTDWLKLDGAVLAKILGFELDTTYLTRQEATLLLRRWDITEGWRLVVFDVVVLCLDAVVEDGREDLRGLDRFGLVWRGACLLVFGCDDTFLEETRDLIEFELVMGIGPILVTLISFPILFNHQILHIKNFLDVCFPHLSFLLQP